MKIGIFTGGTSVRSKNIFTDISRYPTGKHEIEGPICCWKVTKCHNLLQHCCLIFQLVFSHLNDANPETASMLGLPSVSRLKVSIYYEKAGNRFVD